MALVFLVIRLLDFYSNISIKSKKFNFFYTNRRYLEIN